MKVLICGGRDFNDYKCFLREIIINHDEIEEIISGGAVGTDSLAERHADYWGIPITIIKPDWKKYGKSAGFIRNQEMIDRHPDIVVAFWDGVSHGTKDTINRAKKAKIKTLIIYY